MDKLTDPSTLRPFEGEDLQVVIETPKGSRNKYAYDHERRVLVLKKVLPVGMSFPYDFGFVPSTEAEDGDPLDVLVLMEAPVVPGCVLSVRLIGVIEGEDIEEERTVRNDRLLGVALAGDEYANVKEIGDLPETVLRHMEEFFVQYPKLLAGKEYRLLGSKGVEEAKRLVEEARR